MLYEIRCIYDKENPKGELKKVSELYLYDTDLVSQCEARMLEEIPSSETVYVCRSKIIEIVNPDVVLGAYYKAKITETTINEDGNETNKSYQILCNAESLPDATEVFQKHLAQGLTDMKLESVTRTRIVDILD